MRSAAISWSRNSRAAVRGSRGSCHQQLRHELHQAGQQELVLLWETSFRQREDLVARQRQNQQEQHALLTRQEQLTQVRHQKMQRLQEVQEQVKALGEGRLLSVQGELAGLQSRERELQHSLQSQDQGDLAQRQHPWHSRCRQFEAAAEALAAPAMPPSWKPWKPAAQARIGLWRNSASGWGNWRTVTEAGGRPIALEAQAGGGKDSARMRTCTDSWLLANVRTESVRSQPWKASTKGISREASASRFRGRERPG